MFGERGGVSPQVSAKLVCDITKRTSLPARRPSAWVDAGPVRVGLAADPHRPLGLFFGSRSPSDFLPSQRRDGLLQQVEVNSERLPPTVARCGVADGRDLR